MYLPAHITRRAIVPPGPRTEGSDFVDQIRAALDSRPDWLVLDEIRGDEAAAILEAFEAEPAPSDLWTFRGDSQPDRLLSAFGMIIRKQRPAIAQGDLVRLLARHLPFVAAFRVIDGIPRLHLIAEWALDGDTLQLRPLLIWQEGDLRATGQPPVHALELPGDFWE
jgi:hypothetical protein